MGVRLDREDGCIAVVTIDRPEALNALDPETLSELDTRLSDAAADTDVHVVVITGSGDRAFVSGADIKYMSGLGVDAAREWARLGHECANLLEFMPKPTIAAVNGFALGGGCELAIACDFRYASTRARFGQPEVNLGLMPGWGGTQRLARLCGVGIAKELILTGRLLDAEEALGRGLVNAVFEPEELMARTLETARLIASKSSVALAAVKQELNLALQGGHLANLAEEGAIFAGLFATEDAKEGMTAFTEKREPRFTGR